MQGINLLTPETIAVQPFGTVSSKLLFCTFSAGRVTPSITIGKAPNIGISASVVKVQRVELELASLLNSTYIMQEIQFISGNVYILNFLHLKIPTGTRRGWNQCGSKS